MIKCALKATGRFDGISLTGNPYGAIAFYGESKSAILGWMLRTPTQVSFDQDLSIFVGHYTKTRRSQSQLYNPGSVRHQGWGAGTLGNPILDYPLQFALMVSGVVVKRAFIGLWRGEYRGSAPKFFHHQIDCRLTNTLEVDGDRRTTSLVFVAGLVH